MGAAVRLSLFADQLHQLEWTDPSHFTEAAEDELILAHAIKRYYAYVSMYSLPPVMHLTLISWCFWDSFLDLVSTDRKIMFVPTIDIDLVWHTHQMMGHNYIAHCAKYLEYLWDQ